jgi:hypothetical protein
MTHKNILIIGTYPIKKPAHGGQKRLDAIYRIYKKNFVNVRYSAVFYQGFYSDYSSFDIPLSSQSELAVRQSPLTGDMVCGRAIYEDKIVKQKFSDMLLQFKPDIIHIEQPYPYLGLKKLLKELDIKPKLIFGSQNIEGPMKAEMLEGYKVEKNTIAHIAQQITDVEIELSQDCDLLVACTRADLEAHKAMGAVKLVLAPNGVDSINAPEAAIKLWEKRFAKHNINRQILFVGSAHPPNWFGFLKMVGKGLGFVPYDTRIVIAGSVSDIFTSEIKKDVDIQDATFWLRAFSAGRLSEDSLSALLSLADVIMLPITEGGGSNLKTAEAIIANKKVVATSHALRSFEWFRDFPNVWVADTQKDFQEALVKALDTPAQKRNAKQESQAEQVLWEHCMAELMKEAKKV